MATNMTVTGSCGCRLLVTVLCAFSMAASADAQHGTSGEWRVHGGDSGFTRYAPLDQINADTVGDLEIVWRRPAVDVAAVSWSSFSRTSAGGSTSCRRSTSVRS